MLEAGHYNAPSPSLSLFLFLLFQNGHPLALKTIW